MQNFKFPAVLSEGNGVSTVTAFNANSPEPVYMADQYHMNWEKILLGLAEGDPGVWELFDVAGATMRKFNAVTDRVSWDGSEVLFDGDPIHSVLTEQLKRAIQEGDTDNFTALAKFWEKLESNPSQNSKEQAYTWLASHDFVITSEGDIVAYKGLNALGTSKYESTASSRVADKPSAFVNGVPVPPLNRVPQSLGDVVSMPRSEVVDDPNQHCHRGLHVGDWSHAKSYGSVRVKVLVNPMDIVSVPNDVGCRKIRVHKYTLVEEVTGPETGTVITVGADGQDAWRNDLGYKA